VSHPSLGAPPPDLTAAHPEAAEKLRRNTEVIAARALEVAVQKDPTLKVRYDELGLRALLRDGAVYLDRIARSLGSGDTHYPAEWVEWVAPLYRRRRVPMDDLITLSEGLRRSIRSYVSPEEMAIANAAIDGAIVRLRWNRRIAGDARKRNRLLAFIYKGA
jgi:hypothetical protein